MFTPDVIRGSGCTLSYAVYKTGGEAAEQAVRMRSNHDVFAPVLCSDALGYVMPVLQPLREPAHYAMALMRLEELWRRGATSKACRRDQYHAYVRDIAKKCQEHTMMPVGMVQWLDHWYGKTCSTSGHPVVDVHGDATLENAMLLNDSTAVWIDPSVRPVPREAEVDVGKVLQSLSNYHQMVDGAAGVMRNWLTKIQNHFDPDVARYYFVTHVIRLWRHQPAKRDWALRMMEVFA